MIWLQDFVVESNRIEGIDVTLQEVIDAHVSFLALPELTVDALVDFVAINAPGHKLRSTKSVPGVRVGDHIAPPSGPQIVDALKDILLGVDDPFKSHCRYEDLHPFTDGNGRSGRVVWLWMMRSRGGRDKLMAENLGFLHTFYYQTLSSSDTRDTQI